MPLLPPIEYALIKESLEVKAGGKKFYLTSEQIKRILEQKIFTNESELITVLTWVITKPDKVYTSSTENEYVRRFVGFGNPLVDRGSYMNFNDGVHPLYVPRKLGGRHEFYGDAQLRISILLNESCQMLQFESDLSFNTTIGIESERGSSFAPFDKLDPPKNIGNSTFKIGGKKEVSLGGRGERERGDGTHKKKFQF
jgi:hypothetical protein